MREVLEMKLKYLLYSAPLFLVSGVALAGTSLPVANVPAYTPWGAMTVAAVLGICGAYALLKRRK